MTLTYNNGRFIWRGRFEDRHIPKQNGFKWDGSLKQWFTTSSVIAEKLSIIADTLAKSALYAARMKLNASRATDSRLDIPCPTGLRFFPYQKAGVAFAIDKPYAMIADEMGVGKTIQALGLINTVPTINNVLVVCPKSVILNWHREAEKWLTRDVRLEVVNYDILRKYNELFGPGVWDLVIADEAQYLKNPKAKRTQLFYQIPTERTLWLTGTPILNRPVELWPMIEKADPVGLGYSFMEFAKKYCGAKQIKIPTGRNKFKWVWDFSGSTNREELGAYLRQTFMIRRLKKDVLADLPDKTRQLIALPTDGVRSLVREELEQLDFEEAVESLRAGKAIPFEESAGTRRDLGLAKVDLAVNHITDVLENESKVIVFAHHTAVIEQLVQAFDEIGVASITGQTSQKDRQFAIDAFQNVSDCRLFIGNIQAAGTGITLTAASTAIFVEQDWTPGNMAQAEDRAHRIGQKSNVLVQYLVFDGSFDAKLCSTLLEKERITEEVLG